MTGLDDIVSRVARVLHDAAVRNLPPATVKVIANKAKVSEAEALDALTVLMARGLVERVRGGDPLRIVWVYGLTEKLRNSLRLKARQEGAPHLAGRARDPLPQEDQAPPDDGRGRGRGHDADVDWSRIARSRGKRR